MLQIIIQNKYLLLLIIVIILIILESWYIFHLFNTQWPFKMLIKNSSNEPLKITIYINGYVTKPVRDKYSNTIIIIKPNTTNEIDLSNFITINPVTNKTYVKHQVVSLTFEMLSDKPNSTISIVNIPYNTSLYKSTTMINPDYISKEDFIKSSFKINKKYFYTLKFNSSIVF